MTFSVGDRVEINNYCNDSNWRGGTGEVVLVEDLLHVKRAKIKLDAKLPHWSSAFLTLQQHKFTLLDDGKSFVPEDWS